MKEENLVYYKNENDLHFLFYDKNYLLISLYFNDINTEKKTKIKLEKLNVITKKLVNTTTPSIN